MRTSAITTWAPSRAKLSAIARPIPRAPPVMIATRSLSLTIRRLRPRATYHTMPEGSYARRHATQSTWAVPGGGTVSRVTVFSPNAPKPGAPYAQAIKANGFLFVTGQVSRNPATGEFVDGPFEQQFRRAIQNLEAILVAGGSSLGAVTMLTIYMISHDDLDAMNRIL